jgi:hypothetical protein
MKKHLLSICLTLFISVNLFGQLVQINQPIINDLPVKNTYGKITSRSATNPKSCKGDTSYFPNFGSTQYQTLSIGTGQSLGQFYGAPTEITVSGFRFYGFFQYDTARKVTKTTIKFIVFGKSFNNADKADSELNPIFMNNEIISSRNIINPETNARNVRCSLRFFNFF